MILTYTNESGVSLEFKESPPYFLKKLDGIGDVHQSINTFSAPDLRRAVPRRQFRQHAAIIVGIKSAHLVLKVSRVTQAGKLRAMYGRTPFRMDRQA
jgi:hypothetical protein